MMAEGLKVFPKQAKSLAVEGSRGYNKSGPEGATNTRPGPDHSEPDKEVRTMADGSQYSDSAPSGKIEQTPNNWKRLGDLARALVSKGVQPCSPGK